MICPWRVDRPAREVPVQDKQASRHTRAAAWLSNRATRRDSQRQWLGPGALCQSLSTKKQVLLKSGPGGRTANPRPNRLSVGLSPSAVDGPTAAFAIFRGLQVNPASRAAQSVWQVPGRREPGTSRLLPAQVFRLPWVCVLRDVVVSEAHSWHCLNAGKRPE